MSTWREIATLYAQTSIHRRRVNAARRIVMDALSRRGDWYISCSWGKDSVCVQHLVREQAPDTEIVFIDSGVDILPVDREMINAYIVHEKINLVHLQWDRMAYYASQREEVGKKAELYKLMFAPLYQWLDTNPHRGVFMGLRKEESAKRDLSIRRYGPIHEYSGGNQKGSLRCLPIMDWTVQDAAAYIETHQLPLLDIYRKVGMQARSGMFGFGSAQFGRFVYLKRYYPDLYNWFVAQVPEASQFT